MTTRPARQRADYWMERGAADALLRLYASRRLRPEVTFGDAAKIVGASQRAVKDALARARAQGRPRTRRRNAPHAAPHGTKWCGFGQHFPPIGEFAPNRSATTGLQSWCRACMVMARRRERERRQQQSQAA